MYSGLANSHTIRRRSIRLRSNCPHNPPQPELIQVRHISQFCLGGLGQTPQSEELPDPRSVDAQVLLKPPLGFCYARVKQVQKPLGNLNRIEA